MNSLKAPTKLISSRTNSTIFFKKNFHGWEEKELLEKMMVAFCVVIMFQFLRFT